MAWPKFLSRKQPVVEDERSIGDREINGLLTELKAYLTNNYRQEALSVLDDSCTETLKQFKATVGRRCWLLAQEWCQWGENKPILQPNRSRLFYRKGNTDIIVIEEDPQVRTLRFNETFAHSGRYNLALPYVVFVFRFVNGKFCDVYCMFNDKPLGDLSERPVKPYLTNIDGDLKCCLGRSHQLPEGLSYNQSVEFTLNYFWSAEHSNEWSEHWRQSQNYFAGSDARMSNAKLWQKATEENPLFVIDDVTWQKHNRTIGDLIVGLTKTDSKVREFEEAIFQDLVAEFLRSVQSAMTVSLEQSSEKVNGQPPEIIERKLVKAMQKFKVTE